jgi:hypothetical protein
MPIDEQEKKPMSNAEPAQSASGADSAEVKTLAVAVYNLATRGPWSKMPPDWPESNERIQAIAALLSAPKAEASVAKDARVLAERLDGICDEVDTEFEKLPLHHGKDIREEILTRQSAEIERFVQERENWWYDKVTEACNQRDGAEAKLAAMQSVPSETSGDLASLLVRQIEWSTHTFGSGCRTLGILKHIEKEIAEVRAKPDDLTEWVDIILLAIDGYWRHGGRKIMRDLTAKAEINYQRVYPMPTSEDEPSEHVRPAPSSEKALTDSRFVDLAMSILKMESRFKYDSDGPDLFCCPLCEEEIEAIYPDEDTAKAMNKIKHKEECAWVIANALLAHEAPKEGKHA